MAGRNKLRGLAATALLGVVLTACGPAASSPRRTDPHLIVTDAVRATAALSSGRVHVEMVTSLDGANFGAAGTMTSSTAMDADVDIAGRQLAGRGTTQVMGNVGAMGGQGPFSTDVILTSAALFVRQGGEAKWLKAGEGIQGAPTNLAIATAIIGVLDDPRVTYEKVDPVPCTLGQCDHVIVHVDGAALAAALGSLMGVQGGPPDMGQVPNFDIDVRVGQSSSLLSELRMSTGAPGQTVRVLLTLVNPNDAVQIVAPAPGLIDDTSGGFGGGFGGGTTTILSTVGSEIESIPPDEATAEPSLP